MIGGRTCRQCGGSFEKRSRGRIFAKSYCSQTCQRNALRKRAEARAAKRVRPCKRCEKPFTPAWVGREWSKFCSKECRLEHYRNSPFVIIPCAECAVDVKKLKAQIRRNDKSFCSKECRTKHYTGANHASYRAESFGDPKRRSGVAAWQRLAQEIRDRDRHTCRRCGAKHEHGRKFPVDHIVPWRTFEDKAQANDPANLVTLCHSCHTIKTTTIEAAWLRGDVLAFQQYKRDIGVI